MVAIELPMPWAIAASAFVVVLGEYEGHDERGAFVAAVEETDTGQFIACLDVNAHGAPLRKVWLHQKEDDLWVLLDEHGEVLDEPEHGCSSEGFSTDSITADVRLDYYMVKRDEEPNVEEPPPPDDPPVEDCARAKLKKTDQTGPRTSRTSEPPTRFPRTPRNLAPARASQNLRTFCPKL